MIYLKKAPHLLYKELSIIVLTELSRNLKHRINSAIRVEKERKACADSCLFEWQKWALHQAQTQVQSARRVWQPMFNKPTKVGEEDESTLICVLHVEILIRSLCHLWSTNRPGDSPTQGPQWWVTANTASLVLFDPALDVGSSQIPTWHMNMQSHFLH